MVITFVLTVSVTHICFPVLDTDECADQTHDCTQACANTVGSFICQCQHGYYLDTDGHTCTGKVYSC